MSEEQNAGTPPPAPEPPAAPLAESPPAASGVGNIGMNANTWAMGCHLSALSGFVIPFGNFIGPLVIWMIKKDTMPEVDRHGKAALNFQISLAIYLIVAIVISLILMLIVIGFVTLVLTGIAWTVMAILFPILAGLKANEGKDYMYPCTIEFIK